VLGLNNEAIMVVFDLEFCGGKKSVVWRTLYYTVEHHAYINK